MNRNVVKKERYKTFIDIDLVCYDFTATLLPEERIEAVPFVKVQARGK